MYVAFRLDVAGSGVDNGAAVEKQIERRQADLTKANRERFVA
jgi:hypothetical protein